MISVHQTSGVGIHAHYEVRRDGHRLAIIRRFGARHPWVLYSVHYDEPLGSAGSIDGIKAKAESLDYPTAQTIYETICTRFHEKRLASLERAHASDFVRLSREIIAGSNSAREELENLIAEIDRFAADRSDVHPRYKRKDGSFIYSDNWDDLNRDWTWRDEHHQGYYPLPPRAA